MNSLIVYIPLNLFTNKTKSLAKAETKKSTLNALSFLEGPNVTTVDCKRILDFHVQSYLNHTMLKNCNLSCMSLHLDLPP